jgi:hypothetical protein
MGTALVRQLNPPELSMRRQNRDDLSALRTASSRLDETPGVAELAVASCLSH